jgi:hypothetical protein
MIERIEEHFGLKWIGTPYQAAPMLSWLVEEKDAHTFR